MHEAGQQAAQLGSTEVQGAPAIDVLLQDCTEGGTRQAFEALDRLLGTWRTSL